MAGPLSPISLTPAVTPAVEVSSRARLEAPRWELGLRYAAAYTSTLLAIAAAQAKIGASLALGLALVTLLGLPLSLTLRHSRRRWERYRFSRPLFSGVVILLWATASLLLLRSKLQVHSLMLGGWQALPLLDWNHVIELMVSVILIIAACRCLFILSDRDALACVVPSFPVLLLLIVLHRELTVIFYFVAWSVATALLLALDHRAESRHGLSGTVPAVVPSQDIALPARSLGGVICFSLLCSMGLSYGLASRGTDTRAPGENWLYELVSRLSFLAPELPELPGGAGLERRIDFSSGPALPSRRVLWEVRAEAEGGRRHLQPPYWRMFTLAHYDGMTWSQARERELTRPTPARARRLPRRYESLRLVPPHLLSEETLLRSRLFGGQADYQFHLGPRGPGRKTPAIFGAPTVTIEQRVISRVVSVGPLPTLPTALTVTMHSAVPTAVQTQADASVDMKLLHRGQYMRVVSDVPPLDEYGASRYAAERTLPPRRRGERPNPAARLSAGERRLYLRLPRRLPRRLHDLATGVLRAAAPHENDYRRAQRLALFVQNRASYTLRPPLIPPGRDATDFFLFDSRRGYCTYFAGALTVLCRAAGIPARVVSGFANPEWENEPDGGPPVGIVREANGHAWTEVWIDGWGWAMLDATSSDDRGDNAPGLWTELADIFGAQLSALWRWLQPRTPLLGLLLLPLLLTAGALGVAHIGGRLGVGARLRRLAQAQRPGPPPAAADADEAARRVVRDAYRDAGRRLARRFRERLPGETPAEWLERAETALALRDPQPLRVLTALYTRAAYSSRPLGARESEAALRALAQLSWKRGQ